MTFTKREERLNLDLNLCGKDKTSLRLATKDHKIVKAWASVLCCGWHLFKIKRLQDERLSPKENRSKLLCWHTTLPFSWHCSAIQTPRALLPFPVLLASHARAQGATQHIFCRPPMLCANYILFGEMAHTSAHEEHQNERYHTTWFLPTPASGASAAPKLHVAGKKCLRRKRGPATVGCKVAYRSARRQHIYLQRIYVLNMKLLWKRLTHPLFCLKEIRPALSIWRRLNLFGS